MSVMGVSIVLFKYSIILAGSVYMMIIALTRQEIVIIHLYMRKLH